MKSARVAIGALGFLSALVVLGQLAREDLRPAGGRAPSGPQGREVSFRPASGDAEAAPLPPASGSIATVAAGTPAAARDVFTSRNDVFLAAGPVSSPCAFASFLPDGKYYFQVTDPSGQTLLSTDIVSERAVNVKGGVIGSYAGTTHAVDGKTACGSLAVNLMPFGDAGSRKAAYLVWLTPAAAFDGSATVIDPVCGAGCFHGFHPELSRAVAFRVEDKASCDATFCASGIKFADLNGNGVRDSGEPGLSGVEIRVTNVNGVVLSTLTGADGSYRICGLTSSDFFRVSEGAPFGFKQTAPLDRTLGRRLFAKDLGFVIDLCEGDTAGLDFGNQALANAIGGIKFEDLNANGVRDPGEPGLSGVTIVLTPAAGGAARTTTTDVSGNFLFTDVAPGSYVLTEVVPSGFTQTKPPSDGIPVTLASGGSSLDNVFGNFRGILTGTISGVKFNDLNGNGVRDAGEPGVAGVTITLTGAGQPARTAVTGSDGTFTFTAVPFGTYSVAETVPTGFAQTLPGGNAPLPAVLNFGQQTVSGLTFGNRALPSSISGTKFNDVNGNGVRDTGEPGLSGVTIQLRNAAGQLTTATTDSSGNFSFTGLAAGTYLLSEVVPAGFSQTAPAPPGTITVTLGPGQDATGFLFGNRAGAASIAGTKFNDVNGNGVRDTGEGGVAGVTIQLRNSAGQLSTTTTDSSGNFSFTGLAAGTYSISEVVPAGSVQTLPGGGAAISVTLTAGQNATGILFGNQAAQPGSIAGSKFNDLNANGARDAGEPGIQGVSIQLKTPTGQTLTATTDASGNFRFPGLAAGTYVLSETVPANFVQTAPPAPGTFTIPLAAGQNATGFLFGNIAAGGGNVGSISGTKILDINANGVVDGIDRPFEGIVIVLTNSAGVKTQVTTGADGKFSFSNLPAGTYILSEIIPSGFAQTFPGTPDFPKTYTIILAPGQNATGFLFLNKC